MPAYHSSFNESAQNSKKICNAAVLPLKTTTSKGIAPAAKKDEDDIIDEAIRLFRANTFYKSFEIEGGADMVLIYLTVFISHLLREMVRFQSRAEADKHIYTLVRKEFPIPGEKEFTIPGYFSSPASSSESSYFTNIDFWKFFNF